MNDKIYKDVYFTPGENDDFFEVEEKLVFNFFSFRTFKSKTGEPFSIKNVHGPYKYYYFNDQLDLVDIITVTFVYLKLHILPFVLILEKNKGRKNYYRLLSSSNYRWNPIDELNGIPENIQQKSLLDVLKTAFSDYFDWVLWLNESTIKNKIFTHDGQKNIKSEANIGGKYDRYQINEKRPISVSTINIHRNEIEIEKTVKFVEHFYFYCANGYDSTILMMETVDYQIAGSLPYINYFIPESVGNKWVQVECGTDLLEPKCKSDIKRILDGVVEMYRNHPVTINIKNPKYDNVFETIAVFSGIRFSNVCENGKHYISHRFTSKVTKSFFIENILLDDVKQEIDIQSTEFESITVYYKVEQPHKPLLICLKLHNKTNTSVENFKWFYIPSFDKNVWLKLDFEAHPDNDNKLIEQKIKSIYGSRSIINYIMIPLKWLTIFSLIFTLLTLLLRRRRRLRLILMRVYHHIRR